MTEPKPASKRRKRVTGYYQERGGKKVLVKSYLRKRRRK